MDFAILIRKGLQQLGLPTDLDENGYLFATLEVTSMPTRPNCWFFGSC